MNRLTSLYTLLLLPFAASAATQTVDGISWTYIVANNTASVGGGTYSSPAVPKSTTGAITIPSVLGGCPVTSIGACAFYDCANLLSVTIPVGVTNIGSSAFAKCSTLESVSIPASVTSIGDYAFELCKDLDSVTIPYGVTSIEKGTFSQCYALTSVAIPNSVTNIGDNSFFYCSELTSVTIPGSVTRIGEGAFSDCSGLLSVTISNGVTSIGIWAFSNCSELSSVTIPSSVTFLGNYAFSRCSRLSFVTICEGVTGIGDCAFYNCSSLTSILIPDSVTNIMGGAFYNCSGLSAIEFPDNLINIGDSAFYGCSSLTSASISDGTTNIGPKAFYNCTGLATVTIPASVTSIGNEAFSGCGNLKDVVWPGHVSLGAAFQETEMTVTNAVISSGSSFVTNSAFYGCTGLVSVVIPEGVTNIGNNAFCGCINLSSVTIPDGVFTIERETFYNCAGLTSVSLPASVTSIKDWAFFGCSGLTTFTIPNSVTNIGDHAFRNCTGLTTITIPDGVERINWMTFKECTSLVSVTMPPSISSIGEEAFRHCRSLMSVTIPDSVTNIWGSAFLECYGLLSANVPASVTSIGSYAFGSCENLRNVVWPGHIPLGDALGSLKSIVTNIVIASGSTSILNSAFVDCTSLVSITIPDTVATVGASAFSGCTSLSETSIMVGDLTQWCTNAINSHLAGNRRLFMDGEELTEILIPNDVTGIGNYAFYNCSQLTSITIPDSVVSVGTSAFSGCTNLSETRIMVTDLATWCTNAINSHLAGNRRLILDGEELTALVIPNEVTIIGNNAFSNFSGLTSVMIPSTVTAIGNNLFTGCSCLRTIYLPRTLESRKGGLNAPSGCDVILYDHSPTLTTSSSYGSSCPESGVSTHVEFTPVSAYVIPPTSTEDIRYTYLGFTGTGSVPVSGLETNVSFIIYENSSLTWNWRKDNRISVSVSGEGTCDFGVQWVEDGTTITATILTTAHLFNITPDGDMDGVTINGSTLTIPSDKPRSISVFIEEVPPTLTIVSEHGQPIPEAGDHAYPYGTLVSAEVFHETIAEGIRWACTGWSGTGSVPQTGTATNLSFNIREDSSMTWLWEKQNNITVSATGIGTSTFGTQWITDKTMATAMIVPDEPLFAIVLSGDTNGIVRDGGTLTIPSDGPRNIMAHVLGAKDVIEYAGTTLHWQLDGVNTGWWITEDTSVLDGYSLRSGLIGANESSTIYATVDGPGILSFDWRISAGRGTYAKFDLDGITQESITRSTDWATIEVTLGDGPHTLRWTYEKGSITASGEDAAFLDNVRWLPLTLERALDATNIVWMTEGDASWFAQLAVSADGVSAVRSGAVVGDMVSRLIATVSGAGTLTWMWRANVTGTAGVDVFLDGMWLDNLWLDGPSDWVSEILDIEDTGEHTVVFEFWNGGTSATLSDCAYLDMVSWIPADDGGLLPELAIDASPETVTNALTSAGFTDEEGVLSAVGGSAVEYSEFRAWAQGVEGGEAAVVTSAHSGVSYLLGATKPFENAPEILFAGVEINGGGAAAKSRDASGTVTMSVQVVVRDGMDIATVSAERVAQMFEATSSLDDWSGAARLLPVVYTTETDSNGTMSFTVIPGDSAAERAFLRIRVQ